jgi:hypothetical protein
LHEACHWYQQRYLLHQAINLVAIRALAQSDSRLSLASQRALSKVIAIRQLLAPLTEGLALYAQYDYFPSNYYSTFGPRSSFDALLEFVITKRYTLNAPSGTGMAALRDQAEDFFSTWRLSPDCLQRKRALLRTPLLIGEDHVTGYAFVKWLVSKIRTYPTCPYVHDGLLLPFLAEQFFDIPTLTSSVAGRDVFSRSHA